MPSGGTCPHCASRPIGEGGETCGSSYCQEAGYYRNLAMVARKNSRAQKAAFERYNECCKLASREAGYERGSRQKEVPRSV